MKKLLIIITIALITLLSILPIDTKAKTVALILAFLGCTFASGIWSGNLTVTSLGILLGIGSGFFYGLYSIFGRYALAHYRPLTVTFYTFVFAGAGSIFLIRPNEITPCFQNSNSLFLILGLIVVSTALPYIFYTQGLAKIESGKASILASIEPVIASLVGVFAFQEPMSVMVILGLVCILLSVYILK